MTSKRISGSEIGAISAESDNDLSGESEGEFVAEEDSEVENQVFYNEDSSSSSSSESGSEWEEDVHGNINSRDGTIWRTENRNRHVSAKCYGNNYIGSRSKNPAAHIFGTKRKRCAWILPKNEG